MRSSACLTALLVAALAVGNAFAQTVPKTDAKPESKPAEHAAQTADTPAAGHESQKPRTLEGYVEQEKDFYQILRASHPIFKYEKEGRLVGKYQISDREEEFVEFGGGKDYAKENNRQVSLTYRLGMESILDLPNNFVGAKKCGECHPAQYQKWAKSRHAMVVRFPDEMVEIPNKDLNKGLYGSQAAVLPEGITKDDVFAILGTPRTKYGFIDKYLVRGTYHVEDGMFKDGTGVLVAGGNQHSHHWAESLTPDMAKKIAEYVPGFSTKLEAFGDRGAREFPVSKDLEDIVALLDRRIGIGTEIAIAPNEMLHFMAFATRRLLDDGNALDVISDLLRDREREKRVLDLMGKLSSFSP